MILDYLNNSKEDWFLVSWTLSNKCNYRCSYCPTHLHSGYTGQPQWHTVENFVTNFKRPGKQICYRLSGGEPTYWKHFIDLARLVKTQGHAFSFLTNGSQSVDYYNEISQHTDGFIVSYHPEYADISKIIDVCNNVNPSCIVIINLMIDANNFDDMVSVADQISKNTENTPVWPKVVLEKNNIDTINTPASFSTEQTEFLNSWPYFKNVDDSMLHRGELVLDGCKVTANDLIIKNMNNFYGWNCYSGLHMINIDMWGNIYRADCKDGGALGNLERYKLPDSTHKCNMTRCSCLSDLYLRKKSM